MLQSSCNELKVHILTLSVKARFHFVDCDKDSYRNKWTGPGYYKSSAKNAQRLARTEINMAYRTAEQERWKQLDFVVGYEVKTTQNGRHEEDMCDCLAGKYPKDFKFVGWHPQCMCYAIPILKTEDEFWDYDPANPEDSVNQVTTTPEGFNKWIEDNSERIEKASKRGTTPYFIRDNEVHIDEILHPKDDKVSSSVQESQPSLPEKVRKRRSEIRIIAKERYASNPIKIHVLGKDATISNKGIKEWLNQPHMHIAEKNELLVSIQEVIDNSSYKGFGQDLHLPNAFAHLFEVSIAGDPSWIIIRELYNGTLQIHSISDSANILKILKAPNR